MDSDPTILPNVLLIGGLPRAGTTALMDIINEHPEAAIMSEYRLCDLANQLAPILQYQADVERSASETKNSKVSNLEARLSSHTFGSSDSRYAYNLYESEGLNHKLRYPTEERFPSIVANVVRTSLNKPNAQIIGSKRPGSMLKDGGDSFSVMYPSVRYVALLRSPMAQINSSMNRRNLAEQGRDMWHVMTVQEAIDEYIDVVRGLMILREKVGDALLFVKYEDLTSDPERTIDRVIAHAGLAWNGAHSVAAERGTMNVLSPSEIGEIELHLGTIIKAWPETRLTGTNVDLSIFDCFLPSIPLEPINLTNGEPVMCLADGWSEPEPSGIWTDGNSAMLVFGRAEEPFCFAKMVFVPYLEAGLPLSLELMVNGQSVGRRLLWPGDVVVGALDSSSVAVGDRTKPMTMWFGPITLRTDTHNTIEIKMKGVRSPQDLGIDQDKRELGIRLMELQFVAQGSIPQ
ncbi:sulfotransferase [Novosphingobium sp. 9U]|uniref:sulfotransferase family protein n=1 Tax=Novosphingobium sp. 9U TaxID=2653158 RepID=UPI0012EFE89B|nr:sulfotransferase [Novosphingobium sp. 9U]VWX48722.1 hypothetical protein NOVOSPHI9U_20067 [Novosphingobium sp. 9U]